MSRLISIPRVVMDAAPAPKSRSIIDAVRVAIAAGIPAPTGTVALGPYTTIVVPDDIYATLDTGRGSVARYIAAVVLAGEVQPSPTGPRERTSAIPRTPLLTKAQRAVAAARESRVRTAIEDSQDGKWARMIFTAGHRSVYQYREDGDYADEIEARVVFRTVVPQGLSGEEIVAWVAEKRPTDVRMHWYYLDADSETIADARDAEMRAAVMALGGDAAALAATMEREEAMEVKVIGHKKKYAALAARDLELLGHEAAPAVKRLAALAG